MKKVFLILLIFGNLAVFSNVLAGDYTQSCTPTGTATCLIAGYCDLSVECRGVENCSYVCPSPLPNSSFVSETCAPYPDWGCNCWLNECEGTAFCSVSGNCEYDCDEGYYWNGDSCEESLLPEQIEYIENPEHPERYFFLDKTFTYGDLFLIFLLILILIFAIGDRIFSYFWSK